MKKALALVLCVVLALGVLAGCGSSAAPASQAPASSGSEAAAAPAASSGDQVVISVMHRFADEPYKTTFEDLLRQYEADHPNVKFDVTFTATDPYLEKLNILMASDNPPDIFFGFAGEFLNKYIREDLVYDLSEEYNSNEVWKNTWNPTLLEPFWTDGHLWGIDYDLSTKFFFYNTDIFDQYGLEPPQTWSELINICKTLQDNGVLPLSEGDADQWPATHLLSILFHKMVPEDVRAYDYDPHNGSDWSDPGYLKALELYAELAGYMNDDVVSITHSVARMAFAQGESAMAYLESIELADVDKDSEGNLNYGMFAFPEIEGAPCNDGKILGSPEGFFICSKTKNPEIAKDVLYWITGKEAGAKIVEQNQWFNASYDCLDLNTADQKLVDCYTLLANCNGLVNWIDNECHTLIRDVFYSRTQEWLNKDITNEDYMQLIRNASAEAKLEVGG